MTIPSTIHAFWFSEREDDIPDDMLSNIRSWTQHHPQYEVKVWTVEELRSLLTSFHGFNLFQTIDTLRFPSTKSDVVRYAVVYEFGGVWFDLKNKCVAPFLDDYREGPTYLVEHPLTIGRPLPRGYLCSALFGGRPREKLFLECVAEISGLVERRSSKYGGVFDTVGPGMLMRVHKRYLAQHPGWQHLIVERESLWGPKAVRTGASYNAGGRHWKERQRGESMFM